MTLLAVLTLAAYRLWRLLARDDWPPVVWFRDGFDERFDGTFVADGFYCPWCLGAWVSFAVVSVATLFVSVPVPVITALAVSTLVGLIGSEIDG